MILLSFNQGGIGAVATKTRYYFSLDPLRSAGDKRLTGMRSIPSLGPGASSTDTIAVTVPSTTAPGMYYLLACADDTKLVHEGDERNNCVASVEQVTVTP